MSGVSRPLNVLHSRLEAHFTGLHAKRSAIERNAPVFALEHGLSEPELQLLRTEIRGAVRRRSLDRSAWLPIVVYAAEIGYTYSGDEYWQTFEASTPAWAEYGDRQFIRNRFKAFQQRFHGAEPRGAWAHHFSIICWPITHAVLPKDLQRQLAQLLFEYRRSLTSDQLAAPDELGVRLAARAWHTSSRFQAFAENTSLLGHVAAALLVGEDVDEPFLLDSTLARIVEDLSTERQARRWLDDAKFTAARVQAKGLRPARAPWSAAGSVAREKLPAAVDPGLMLRRERDGWRAYLEMPDFSVLAERLPDVAQDLRSRRAMIRGTSGPPLARGRLMYPDQVVQLDTWPDSSGPLVQLEAGRQTTNSLLADQSVLTPGPVWLFRLREPNVAREVRGKSVRPGNHYILVTTAPVATDLPAWVDGASCATTGVEAYSLTVPEDVTPEDLESLSRMRIGIVTDVDVRPVGTVPARWDGDGRGEWLTGEEPVLAISSARSVQHVIVTNGGVPQLLEWPNDGRDLFLRFERLDVGTHEVKVSLLFAGDSARPAEGSFEIAIRAPHTRSPAGTMREALMSLASPAGPTLPEIWDGTAAVEFLGPRGVQVDVEIALFDRQRKQLTQRRTKADLPVDTRKWHQLFATQLRTQQVAAFYDSAERARVTASHPALGIVAVEAERPFAPLRWAIRRDGNEAVLKLVNNTAGADVSVVKYAFSRPDFENSVAFEGKDLRVPEGGLLVARAGNSSAGIIVPRTVKNLADMGLDVALRSRPRAVDGALELIALARAWSTASLPAEPIARVMRLEVLHDITHALTGLIAGERWARAERRVERAGTAPLAECIGGGPTHRALARELVERAATLIPERVDDAVEVLAVALAHHGPRSCVDGRDMRLAELLLRLVTAPGSLPNGDLRRQLQTLIETPLLVKAARLLVLATPGQTNLQEWTWH